MLDNLKHVFIDSHEVVQTPFIILLRVEGEKDHYWSLDLFEVCVHIIFQFLFNIDQFFVIARCQNVSSLIQFLNNLLVIVGKLNC